MANIDFQGQEFQPDAVDAQENKYLCILSYFGILFLIPFLMKQTSEYVKFHSNQGLLLFILNIGLTIVSSIAGTILGFIPYIGVILSGLIGLAFSIVGLVLMIMGIINTANGKMKELPVIGSVRILK